MPGDAIRVSSKHCTASAAICASRKYGISGKEGVCRLDTAVMLSYIFLIGRRTRRRRGTSANISLNSSIHGAVTRRRRQSLIHDTQHGSSHAALDHPLLL